MISTERIVADFSQWLLEQKRLKRAGKRTYVLSMNNQGEVTAVHGESPRERRL